MKRSRAVPLTLISSLAAFLTSCRDNRPSRYCVDESQQVIADSNCNTTRGRWYYGGAHGIVGMGTLLRGGSFAAPRGGFSTPEGSTVRGIFGGSGRAFSGGNAGGGGGGE